MTIYLRADNDANGDLSDLAWYCSEACYNESLGLNPPTDTFEEGGAWPCGAESDNPDYCESCGEPIGNPLTDVGEAYVDEYVTDVLTNSGDGPYTGDQIARAETLQKTYSYIFDRRLDQ